MPGLPSYSVQELNVYAVTVLSHNNATDDPGGGTQVQRGAAPALRISRKKGSFLRPPHVRDFVKEGYFCVPRYEVWGVKIPLQATKYTRI